MSPDALADLATDAIDDLKGSDTRRLGVAELTTIADYMIVTTGTSARHVKAIADNVVMQCKNAGHRPRGVEGMEASEWILVDLGDVIVHVMQAQPRAFYQLEKLWEMPAAPAAPAAESERQSATH